MPVLGTKQFWIPAEGSGRSQAVSQILKNSGYISIQLFAVNYLPAANFWQKTFGGTDCITLSSNIRYQNGHSIIESSSVQDVRTVKVKGSTNLALQRNLAVKVPATADAISLDVVMTAVKSDILQAKFSMLNKPHFQSALELAPLVVGQVMVITSLVKDLLTDNGPHGQVHASYAGIIGTESQANPISQGRLTAGYLLLINSNDLSVFDEVDVTGFHMKGTTLYRNDDEIENTYIVFNISFDKLKGEDQTAGWFDKYNQGLSKLDEINVAAPGDEINLIYNAAKKCWIEGNALLDADDSYIQSERIQIKAAAFKALNDYYQQLTNGRQGTKEEQDALKAEVINELIAKDPAGSVQDALPLTSMLVEESIVEQQNKQDSLTLNNVLTSIGEDVRTYLTDLRDQDQMFSLGR